MEPRIEDRICSFCGNPGSGKNRLAGGLGAMICFECLEWYYQDTRSSANVAARTRPVWDEMSDAELLAKLPLIVQSAEQNAAFVTEWVSLIRERKVSWAQIGKVLGVSRQAAWERFASHVHEGSASRAGG